MISEDAIGMAKEWLGKAYRLGDSEVEDPSFTRHNMEVAFVAGSCAERKACAEHYLGIMRAAVAAEREASRLRLEQCEALALSVMTNKMGCDCKRHGFYAGSVDDICPLCAERIRARGQA